MTNEAEIDWSGVDLEMARQIVSDGEAQIDAQFRSALSADQRAMTSASIFIGFAGAVLAVTLGYWARSNPPDWALLVPGLTGAAVLIVAACFCLIAARPVDIYVPGSPPKAWWGVIDHDLAEVLGGHSESIQDAIDKNDDALDSNARWLLAGMCASVVAPLLAFATWLFL